MDESRTHATPTECPLCEARAISFWADRRGHDLYRCESCRLIFVFPMPAHLEDVYTADYFTGAEQGHGYTDYEREKQAMSSTFEEYLRRIQMRLPAPAKLLDVGAATGTFIELASKAGYAAEGVELSPYAAEAARKKGLRVVTGRLEDGDYAPGSFDVITLFDVFEHVTDPKGILDSAKRLLRPGGILVVNTVDAESLYARMLGKYWHLIVPPEHLLYFSVSNFSSFVTRNGFTVRETAKIGKSFPFPYVLSTGARWVQLPFLERIARRASKTFLQRIKLPIHFRDLFFMIAEKDAVTNDGNGTHS